MKRIIVVLAIMFVLATGSTVMANPPSGSVYLDGGASNVAVILCHGRAQHPRWKVVDPLRKEINKQLGYHTLSLQLPGKGKDWEKYAEEFPRAYKEIQAGIDFLRKEKGVIKIYLIGHSMGSRMATAFLVEYPDSGIAGFIGVGIKNGGKYPLDSNSNLRKIKIPVLDVYGDGGDGKDKIEAEVRSNMVSDRYQQVLIPKADHVFDTGEEDMVRAVIEWLKKQGE
ncbi:MAG: alpha/beta hydrolase [bacterium]